MIDITQINKELKHIQLPSPCTIADIQFAITESKANAQKQDNLQMGIKIFINSIYGATASPYFFGYNQDLAEAITMQGQDIIKFASKILNKYFIDFWHKDKELHARLKIDTPNRVTRECVIYGDTDSVYATFKEILDSIPDNTEGREIEIMHAIKEYRLKDYFRHAFEAYAKRSDTENIQDFELETISHSAILLAKKKYVLELAWDDSDTYYEPQQKIKPKGVEMVQSSTPPFARKRLIILLKRLFKERKNLNLVSYVKDLKELRKQFELEDIDEITLGSGIGDYEKGIKNDTTAFEVYPHCPMHVKAAGIYNHTLNKNPELKQKYSMIRSGDKVKYYFSVDPMNTGMNVFAYLPGMFPYEFAPTIDYDRQFERALLKSLNRFLVAMGFSQISPSLIVSRQLF